MSFSEIDPGIEHVLIAVESQFSELEISHFCRTKVGFDFGLTFLLVGLFVIISNFVDLLVLVVENRLYTCSPMDDDSCVLKYIEIVPLDNNAEQTEDLKPFEVRVCIVT